MSADFDPVLFVVNLAVNLFLFGLVIAGSVAVSFRLMEKAAPRRRYVVTVTAFVISAFVPLAVTLNGSTGLNVFIEAFESGGARFFDHHFVVQTSAVAPEIVSSYPKPEPEKTSVDLLNYFTTFIADSFVGTALFGLWISGSLCFLLRDFVAHRRLKKTRQCWRPATDSERKELDFPCGIPLYFGEESPAALGLLRPVIVLPSRFPDGLQIESKRFIVRHELSHARWRDPLVNWLLRLIRSLFWVSPALWMLERTAVAERESAADYAAIAECSSDESQFAATALSYATTLVSVAKHFNSLSPNAVGLSDRSILESRIRRMLAHSPKNYGFRVSLASTVFLVGLIGLLFMPVASQSKETTNLALEAPGFVNQKSENSTGNKNSNNLPILNQRNTAPEVVRIYENKGREANSTAPNRDENEQLSNKIDEVAPLSKADPPDREEPADPISYIDDGSEDLMRQMGEEDAKASGFDKKLDKLSEKVQGLDAARKNLGSKISQVRDKAASQIDSLIRQIQSVNDSKQNININANRR